MVTIIKASVANPEAKIVVDTLKPVSSATRPVAGYIAMICCIATNNNSRGFGVSSGN